MENSYENKKHLSRREQIIYGISNGGQVFGYSLVTSYLMYFYINVFLIDAKIISLIFLLGGIWDIINNPLIGIFIDHKENKAGKLTSIIRKITPIQAVATSLIFLGPVFIKDNSNISATKITYLLITYFLWEFMYSITDVAFGGLVAVITPNPIERQKTISTANICMQLASSLVFVAVPLLIDVSKSDKFNISLLSVFVVIGLSAGIVGIGLFSLSGYFVKERIQQTKTVQPIKELLISVAKNKPLVLLLLSNLISSFSGIGFAFSTYYYLDVLGYASMSILVETPAFVISLFSYSLIKVAKKQLNNKKIIILSYLCISTFRFLVFFIGLKYYSNLKVMVPLLIGSNCIVAIFGGINNVLPIELLTEATDYAEWKTGVRTEGIAFSLKNSVVKVYGTLAQGFAAVLLNVIGYIPSASSEITTQADGVQKKIWIIFSLIPAVIGMLSVIPLAFYNIVDKERNNMFEELKESRKNII
ncbi:MAG: MFS transporter [Ruminococcaceae bacterium]|nr:MFS transporter [Oscillospiraceae bacterium]